eukprot:820906-Amphidinium_carterae.1
MGPFKADILSDTDSSSEDESREDLSNPRLLPRSLHIVGICHITHNAMWAVTTKMKQWTSWYARVKNVCALLSHPDRMRR